MAKFVFGMNVSLDGYVDHDRFAPGAVLFRHWIEQVQRAVGAVYGRRIYQIMQYWDEDQSGWDAPEHDFAAAWRALPKWVVSRSLTSAGPNATLIDMDDIPGLKARLDGEVDVCGTLLAHSLHGLIDEYRLYYHPVVLGRGTPFFAGPRPPLRLTGTDRIGDSVVRLTYAAG